MPTIACEKRWDHRFAALRAKCEELGCLPEGAFGKWVAQLREVGPEGLSEDHARQLESLPSWTWSTYQDAGLSCLVVVPWRLGGERAEAISTPPRGSYHQFLSVSTAIARMQIRIFSFRGRAPASLSKGLARMQFIVPVATETFLCGMPVLVARVGLAAYVGVDALSPDRHFYKPLVRGWATCTTPLESAPLCSMCALPVAPPETGVWVVVFGCADAPHLNGTVGFCGPPASQPGTFVVIFGEAGGVVQSNILPAHCLGAAPEDLAGGRGRYPLDWDAGTVTSEESELLLRTTLEDQFEAGDEDANEESESDDASVDLEESSVDFENSFFTSLSRIGSKRGASVDLEESSDEESPSAKRRRR